MITLKDWRLTFTERISQKEMAAQLGVSQSLLSAWEKGLQPPEEYWQKMVRLYNFPRRKDFLKVIGERR